MAIVEMKHVDMLALRRDKQALLRAVQKLRCFQITPQQTDAYTFNPARSAQDLPSLEETLTRMDWAIGKLSRYNTVKKPFLSDLPSISEQQAEDLIAGLPSALQTIKTLEALERKAGDLRGQSARVGAAREQLLPWQSLNVPLHEIHDTKSTVQMLGTLPKEALETWLAEGNSGDLCYVKEISQQRDLACVYLVLHRFVKDEALQKLKDIGFTQVSLRDVLETAAERIRSLDAEKAELERGQQETVAQIQALAVHTATLQKLHDLLFSKRERLQAAKQLTESEQTFFLQGWVPAPMTQTVEETLKKVSPTIALDFYDPRESEEPPVLLHNSMLAAPYESVVSGFSLPAPRSFDPTAIMMPFFVNFMGMMISDAGYGLMMAIILPILILARKPAPGTRRLMWILTAGAVATIFWGALYNSWFGFGLFPSVFDPMKNAMPVMMVSHEKRDARDDGMRGGRRAAPVHGDGHRGVSEDPAGEMAGRDLRPRQLGDDSNRHRAAADPGNEGRNVDRARGRGDRVVYGRAEQNQEPDQADSQRAWRVVRHFELGQ